MPVKVLIADAHPILRYGIHSLLDKEPDIEVVGEAREGSEVLPKIQKLKPDVVLVDHDMSGVDLAKIVQLSSEIKASPAVIVFTARRDPLLVKESVNVGFLVKSLGGSLFFTPGEAVFVLANPLRAPAENDEGRQQVRFDLLPPTVVRVRYLGARAAAEIAPAEPLPGVAHYLLGNDPAGWLTNAPTYAGIVYRDIYPGIDLRYEGAEGQLKSLFQVAPGANPAAIRWRYTGAASLSLAEDGDLLISLPAPAQGRDGATLIERAPLAWQEIDGQKAAVRVHYALNQDGSVGFALPEGYDPAWPLVIDPELVYSTYLGGSKAEEGNAIAVDGQGNVYVAGSTFSSNFPTVEPLQANPPGGDAFVSKLNPAGDALLYSTYLGGNGNDAAWGLALDGAGRITLVGETESSDFPTLNAYDAAYGGGTCGSGPCDDVFVTQLTADGSALVYSTYLGGSGDDEGTAMAIGPGGLVHVTGLTNSADFPTLNAYDSSFGGGTCGDKPCADVFVAVVDPSANGAASLRYSTYLGGNKYETGKAIAVDENGHTYVAGYTSSNDFPTRNPYQASRAGSSDAFVVKLDAGLSGDASLLYGTFLGGSGSDYAYGLALNGVDRVYLTGATLSSDFPLANAFDGSFGGGTCGAGACMDAFAAQLELASNSLVYSTYLGGSGEERGEGIVVDGQGSAYLTGYTKSDDFPLADPLQASMGGEVDAYLTKLSAAGNSLLYSTYLGGSGEDYGNAIALGSAGSVYLTGYSLSADFPITPGAYATSPAGGSDAFVVKISEPPGGMSPTYNWRFDYDVLYRLVYACSAWDTGASACLGDSFDYSYDGAGNLLWFSRWDEAGAQVETVHFVYNGANQIECLDGNGNGVCGDVEDVPYTYDPYGNLTSDGVRNYSYDSANRLVSVSDVRNPVMSISESGRWRSPRPAMPIACCGGWRSPVRGERAG